MKNIDKWLESIKDGDVSFIRCVGCPARKYCESLKNVEIFCGDVFVIWANMEADNEN